MRLIILSLTLLLTTALPVRAADQHEYEFDKAHTQILFFVDHLGFSMSQGEFHDYSGGFTFDRSNPENSSVDVTIRSESIDMDHDKWDAHMKNADFLNVTEYPTMAFKSTDINVTGGNTAEIAGDFTMLGVTRPVTLNVTHNKSGVHPFSGRYVSGFSAEAKLQRSEFGMNYGLPNVGDTVHIRLEVEGMRIEQDKEEEEAGK